MENYSFLFKLRYVLLIIFFILINFLSIYFIFNTYFFLNIDNSLLSINFTLFVIGISLLLFIVCLKLIKTLTINRILIIYLITRVIFLIFFSIFEYGVAFSLQTEWLPIAQNIYWSDFSIISAPPLLSWWYFYNYYVYNLFPLIWRFLTVILEILIVYIILRISQEVLNTKKNTNNNQSFKIGLLFYTFSIFPIIFFILYASEIALTILLGLLGIYYYLKSEKDSKNLYYSILFFTLCFLTSYLAIIWLGTIIALIIRKKLFKSLIILFIQVFSLSLLIYLPWLISNSDGLLQSLFYIPTSTVYSLHRTIWFIGQGFENLIPFLFALILVIVISYYNYDKMKSLDLFLINFSIALIFSSILHPWSYLWIFPILSINIAYSFRKYLRINLIFLSYLFIYYLSLALLFLFYPNPIDPNPYNAFIQIISFGETIGINQIFILFISPIFQIGLIYTISAYTKSRTLNFGLISSFCIVYSINFLIWLGSILY